MKKIIILLIAVITSGLNAQSYTSYAEPLKQYDVSWWNNPYEDYTMVSVADNYFESGWYFVSRLLAEDQIGRETAYLEEIKKGYNNTSKRGGAVAIELMREFSHFQQTEEIEKNLETGDSIKKVKHVRIYKILIAVGIKRQKVPENVVN